MKVVSDISRMRNLSLSARKSGKKIGFVPTMGYLHQGHLSLIRAARNETEFVVLSIFVNPTQFAPGEDFDRYPRNLQRDITMARKAGTDVIFHPSPADMYPEHFSTYVEETILSKHLCGLSRPAHFRGVATVVLKLFNIVLPHIAYFGQKDAQQAIIIKRMARDLNIPVIIETVPTVREKDGLAISSRNEYLSPEQREHATLLYMSLVEARNLIRAGETDPHIIKEKIRQIIRSAKDARIDYISISHTDTLEEAEQLPGNIIIALAVFIGETRLIDNLQISVPLTQDKEATK